MLRLQYVACDDVEARRGQKAMFVDPYRLVSEHQELMAKVGPM